MMRGLWISSQIDCRNLDKQLNINNEQEKTGKNLHKTGGFVRIKEKVRRKREVGSKK